MHSEQQKKWELRKKRAFRVRNRIRGTRVKPRLSVFKSNKHVAVQLIDDEGGVTLACASTYSKEKRGTSLGTKSKEAAAHMGKEIAALAKGLEVKELVFDRGCYKYHGMLASLADALRAEGMQF